MNEVNSISNYPVSTNKIQKNNLVSFRAETNVVKQSQNEQVDTFIKEQEKARKNAKRQQNFSNFVLGTIALSSLATLGFFAHQSGWFKRFKPEFMDLSAEKKLGDMALPVSQRKAANRITTRVKNYAEMIKKGGKKGSAILFYGPPGTGKNTFAYGIAKEFPNAKFLEMDISKMNSKWHGESEQNVLGTMKAAIKYARKHKNEKVFVFIDEIDSVMMQDHGNGAKLSNDILNAFKKGFNRLTNEENIIVMGATNLKINPELAMAEGKALDTAMLDRFAQKVLVDLPTKEQILESVNKFYNNPNRDMIDSSLKNIKDSRWNKIANFLSDKKHATSFRKLNDILGSAAESTEVGKNVTFEEIINAIKDNQHNLNVTDIEMKAFLDSLK